MENYKTLYKYSLLILFVFGIVTNYYTADNASTAKLVINLHIYFSLLFLLFINLKHFLFDFSRHAIILISLLIAYGLISIIRDIPKGEFFSLFGNPLFGPSFLLPLFIIWGTRSDALYWLHRISMYAIKIGIFLTPIAFFFKVNVANITFYPTFFLLLNYRFAPNKDKIWIILSYLFGSFFFYINDLRSGIARIILCLVVFILLQFNLKRAYKYLAIALIIFPIYIIYLNISTDRNILSEVLTFGSSEISGSKNLTADTRTFLYVELLSDLEKTDNLIFGKGPLGTYYSDYFRNYAGTGDHFIRHDVEVGVLSYLLRGGISYLLLIFLTIILAIFNGLNYSNNSYIISLSLILSTFLFYSFIENVPNYSFYFASIWIIVGVCMSRKFVLLDDNQIKNIIRNKELTYSQNKGRIIFNIYSK